MPVQINEMIIRANITEGDTGDNNKSQQPNNNNTSNGSTINKDEIVKECAAMVMEIINNKNQR